MGKPKSTPADDDDIRADYGPDFFKGGVRGKYADRVRADAVMVTLAPDVAKVFKDSQQVNAALRVLIDAAERAARPEAAKTTRKRKSA